MTRHLFGLIFLAGCAVAMAQQSAPRVYPVPGPLNYLPYYPPQVSSTSVRPPLSPYLNLLNGNNPALNYYYGVRPLTQTAPVPLAQPMTAPSMPSSGFFQPSVAPRETTRYPDPDDTKRFTLPSPGSPVVYGNSFGNSRAGISGRGYFAPVASKTTSGSTPGATTQPPGAIPKSK
jgi:hypothetical protein